jgi:hypothetical protein
MGRKFGVEDLGDASVVSPRMPNEA